jgi:hypothetical protein
VADLRLYVNDVDITASVEFHLAVHEMFNGGHADVLTLEFDDTSGLWDKWQLTIDAALAIEYGNLQSGYMHIYDLKQHQNLFCVKASSCPQDGFKQHSRKWQMVRLSKILKDIATSLNLDVKTYGTEDWLYQYIEQDDESDYAFLQRRLALEGYQFSVFDNTLVVYSRSWAAAKEPVGTITIAPDIKFGYEVSEMYKRAELKVGDFIGVALADYGSATLYKTIEAELSSQFEANRFAANLLDAYNDNAQHGYVYWSGLMHTPATVVTMSAARSWDGDVVLDRVRNDYVKETSKIMFHRRPQ